MRAPTLRVLGVVVNSSCQTMYPKYIEQAFVMYVRIETLPDPWSKNRRAPSGGLSNYHQINLVYYPRVVGTRGPSAPGSASGQNATNELLAPGLSRALETLAEEAERKLLKSIYQCQTHVLRHLLTDKPISTRSLCFRAYNFILPLQRQQKSSV